MIVEMKHCVWERYKNYEWEVQICCPHLKLKHSHTIHTGGCEDDSYGRLGCSGSYRNINGYWCAKLKRWIKVPSRYKTHTSSHQSKPLKPNSKETIPEDCPLRISGRISG